MYRLGESNQETQIQHLYFFDLGTDRLSLLNYVNALILCCVKHNLEL